jgi:hypothetical protein
MVERGKWMMYTQAEIYVALRAAGFAEELLPTMDAIAGAESSWTIGCVQEGQPYRSTGWGTWQITPGNSEPAIGIDDQLLPLDTNARAAYAKWLVQGLHAWSTYTSGKYKSYAR